jgi:putative ABC transport system permease protein
VLAASTLLATAAAAAPLFLSSAGDAAMTDVLHAVPPRAPAADAAVVRLNGGTDPEQPLQAALLAQLARVPGLTRPSLSAASIGREMLPPGTLFTPYVSSGGTRVGARLFGQEDLAASLVPVAGGPSVAQAGAGVWLPEPVAARLHARPGGSVTLGVATAAGATRTPVRLAGVYRVASDGRTPLDVPGSDRWADRSGLLPVDPDQLNRDSYLVVADARTVQELADSVGDTLLWSAKSGLDPARPTLASAQRTAGAVQALQRYLLDSSRVTINQGPLRPTVVSGFPKLVAQAESATDATVDRTRSVGWAGIVLGLTAVLAVAVLTATRRRHEIAHATGVGMRPVSVGGLAAVEVLPVAALGWLLGLLLAYGVVATWGPPATPSAESVRTALRDAALDCGLGVVLVAVTAATVAAVVARSPGRSGLGPRRAWPWEVGLAVVAVTATASLVGHANDGGPLALLVPLLVVAATGALAGRAVLSLVARLTAPGRRSADATRGPTAMRGAAPPRAMRAPTLWLAARRIAVPGAERVLVVTLLTTGLGMLLYAVTAASAVRTTTEDRVAALSGASDAARIDGSWQLDPTAPMAPEPVDPGFATPVPRDRLPLVGQPPLTAGTTVTWRATGVVPGQSLQFPVLVVDPATFGAAASWGTGPDLAKARSLLPGLGRTGAAVAAQVRAGDNGSPVPALLVGDPTALATATAATAPALQAGDRVSVAGSGGTWTVPLALTDVLATFPGVDPDSLAMVVVPADAFFAHLGAQDPRYAPRPGQDGSSQFQTEVWSRGARALDSVLSAHHVTPLVVRTDATVRQLPDFVAALRSLGYLLALGAATAGLAVVGLGLFADRSAARARVDDLMLARVGIGRRRTRRAHLLELAGIVATASVAAGVAVLVLSRLGALGLDPQAPVSPALHLRVGLSGVTALLVAAVACVVVGAVATRGQGRRRDDGGVLRADV